MSKKTDKKNKNKVNSKASVKAEKLVKDKSVTKKKNAVHVFSTKSEQEKGKSKSLKSAATPAALKPRSEKKSLRDKLPHKKKEEKELVKVKKTVKTAMRSTNKKQVPAKKTSAAKTTKTVSLKKVSKKELSKKVSVKETEVSRALAETKKSEKSKLKESKAAKKSLETVSTETVSTEALTKTAKEHLEIEKGAKKSLEEETKAPAKSAKIKPKLEIEKKQQKTLRKPDIEDITEEIEAIDAAQKEKTKEKAPKFPKAEKGRKAKDSDDIVAVGKNDTMKSYMTEIGKIPLVTKEEEVELAAKIHGKDPVAREEARTTLINANLRLVVKIAHDFKGLGLPLLDLISEGNIGLMRAVEKFDPAKGAKFSSYAAWWIKQSMRRALANQAKTIRIPVQSAGKINKIKSARLKLAEKLGRDPSDAEIAEYLEFSQRTVSGLRLADLKTFSLHDPIQQGEDGEFQDIIPDQSATIPDRMLGDIESVARLSSLLSSLDEREKSILRMRFGLDGYRPKTLEEVSQDIGRTRERVRQIQNQALAKLRNLLADESGFVSD